jgi:hypothetical protein
MEVLAEVLRAVRLGEQTMERLAAISEIGRREI